MFELLATLTPIALIDSLSIIPVAIVPLALLLGGNRPMKGTLAFLGGIGLVYLPFGILLLYGLDALFDNIQSHFDTWWHSEPDIGEIILEIIIGLVMMVFGHKLCAKRQGTTSPESSQSNMNLFQAFGLGAIITLSGLWGALPYFAAIAQILKGDLSPTGMLSALLFYNLIFIMPLVAFPVIHLLLGDRSRKWFTLFKGFVAHWGNRVLVTLLIALGFIMFVDGISWLYGSPLIVTGKMNP